MLGCLFLNCVYGHDILLLPTTVHYTNELLKQKFQLPDWASFRVVYLPIEMFHLSQAMGQALVSNTETFYYLTWYCAGCSS